MGLCYRRKEKYNSRGYRFLMFTGISAGNLLLYPRGGVFPLGHGYIRGKSFPVPVRRRFSARPRVYPREILSCTRAAVFFRPATGIFAGNLSCTRAVAQKKPPYRRMQRIVRYDGSVIIIIIWQRLPQPQALRPLEVLLLPRMNVLGKVL